MSVPVMSKAECELFAAAHTLLESPPWLLRMEVAQYLSLPDDYKASKRAWLQYVVDNGKMPYAQLAESVARQIVKEYMLREASR